ncbi:MAG: hypothetical protein RR238_09905, partial [Lachnospiraceae bacterium]
VNPIAIDPTTQTGAQVQRCPHDEAFFQNPTYQAVIQQQAAELQQRAAAAAAAGTGGVQVLPPSPIPTQPTATVPTGDTPVTP